MKRRRLLTGVAALTATAARANAQALPTVRITCLPSDSYGEAYYARKISARSPKHGLAIQIVASTSPAPSGSMPWPAAAPYGVSVANPLSIAQAAIKGIPITIIAGGGLYTTASPAARCCSFRSGRPRIAPKISKARSSVCRVSAIRSKPP